MQLITITGGQTLHGRIRPAAAKNSVLPLLAATLLCRTPSRLRAVPPLADVATSLALLQSVGAKAERQGSDLFVAPGQDLQGEIPDYLAGAMRGVLSGAAALPGGRGAPAAARWLQAGPPSRRHSPGRAGGHGCPGGIGGHRRDTAAARTAPRGRFRPAPAQRGGYHDPDDGRDPGGRHNHPARGCLRARNMRPSELRRWW